MKTKQVIAITYKQCDRRLFQDHNPCPLNALSSHKPRQDLTLLSHETQRDEASMLLSNFLQ